MTTTLQFAKESRKERIDRARKLAGAMCPITPDGDFPKAFWVAPGTEEEVMRDGVLVRLTVYDPVYSQSDDRRFKQPDTIIAWSPED